MKVFKRQQEVVIDLKRQCAQKIGLVPTMGALHAGHLALVEQATKENDRVVVSIFVNPTQFDDANDLLAYPKSLAEDLQKLSVFEDKVIIYAPEVDDLYPETVQSSQFEFGALEKTMEGASRNGHFQGVATIVHKLLLSFLPTKAYFGEKDYQQLRIIHALVAQCKLPIQIVDCPIIREKDGLAMSSRNRRLSQKHRDLAPIIYKTLLPAKKKKDTSSPDEICQWVENIFDKQPDFELDYFCIADAESLQPISASHKNKPLRAFIAVRLGAIRLIDNINF